MRRSTCAAMYYKLIHGGIFLLLTHDFEWHRVALAATLRVDRATDVVPEGVLAHVLEDEALGAHDHAGRRILGQRLALQREKKTFVKSN